MGEVYRAEDLKLDQPVALKFLPAALADDKDAQARFLREVRVARQVSHPSVCRVFDIGEADGLLFITMEYIDGEDLSTLLRRIGRLPEDKALEIARQICAGLAAAHDAGLLHRDLKPANIMIDGRGKARVTDFGLAGLAGQFSAADRNAGTPAYMAPEQFRGGEPSIRTDIYALGLVLYELFTGKRAFEAQNFQELARQREQGIITHPSSHVKDIDPLVERVILRCLENHPAQRPKGALAVAAALPGGDPLAAALAAGETPSPAMVAAAGDETAIRPAAAWSMLCGALVFALGILLLTPYASDLVLSPPERTPEFLLDSAHDLAKTLGYTDRPLDSASWFELNYEFLLHRATKLPFPERTRALPSAWPGAYSFWYRQSPRPLTPLRMGGVVSEGDPPESVSGMLTLVLDSRGWLLRLEAVPPQIEEPSKSTGPPDWNELFSAAGLDPARFSPAAPRWVPPEAFDSRAAWEGSRTEEPNVPLHVTAASFHGRFVYFGVFGPWTRPARVEEAQQSRAARISAVAGVAVVVFLMLGALYFGGRNLKKGRGDTKGATKISVWIAVGAMLAWALHAHHVADARGELSLVFRGMSECLLFGFVTWALYVTLEPFVRRRWPQVLISWSRLLAGQYQDRLIGRDILVGAFGGALIGFLVYLQNALPYWYDFAGETPLSASTLMLGPLRTVATQLISAVLDAPVSALIVLALLFLFRVLFRAQWASVVLTTAVLLLSNLGGENFRLEFPLQAVVTIVSVAIMVRFGFLAFIITQTISNTLTVLPLTYNFSYWYAARGAFGLLALLALWLWGLRQALGGRPFHFASLDE
jgi:serine/threonine-protein kinase